MNLIIVACYVIQTLIYVVSTIANLFSTVKYLGANFDIHNLLLLQYYNTSWTDYDSSLFTAKRILSS